MGRLNKEQSAETMKGLLGNLVRELVDRPRDVAISMTLSDGANTVVLTVRTAEGEIGKVIGKQGRNAQALRVILEAVAAKYRQRIVLEIDDAAKRDRRPRDETSHNMGRS